MVVADFVCDCIRLRCADEGCIGWLNHCLQLANGKWIDRQVQHTISLMCSPVVSTLYGPDVAMGAGLSVNSELSGCAMSLAVLELPTFSSSCAFAYKWWWQ
jgi:hypothetical protein